MNPRTSGVWVACATLALLAFAGPAAAQILNVPSATYPTIQSAVDAAAPGDTIVVAAGTFTSAAAGPGVVNVVGKTDLTIDGAGTTATIVDAQQNYQSGFHVENCSNVTISNLTVRMMNRHGIISYNSAGTTIEDVRAQGLGFAVPGPTGVVYGFGILNTPNSTVDGVTAEDCSGGGFQFTGGSTGCTLSNFIIVNSAGVPGFAAIAYDTIGGIDVIGGDVGVAVSGANSIIGSPSGFLFLDSPAGTITTSLAGTTSVFGVVSEVSLLGLGTITGLSDYLTGLGLTHVVSGGSAMVPTGLAYFSSLANAAIGVALAPNPETAVITELGTSTVFVAPGMSVQAAVDAAGMGGTVCILPGSYSTMSGGEVVYIDEDGLTLKGVDRDTVILDSQAVRNYVIRIDGATGVTIQDLTVTGANFEHLTGIDADGLVVQNVRVAGAGNTVQGVSGRIHGVVLNSGSVDVSVAGLIASDLSGAGLQVSPGGRVVVSDATLTDVAGNIGFGAISVFVAGGVSIPDGNSRLTMEGTNTITTTMPGGTAILLGDVPGFVLDFIHESPTTTTFSGVALPLARFGEGCVPLLDHTAAGMGLDWKVTGGEPLVPNGEAFFPDQATAMLIASLATDPMSAVVEQIFANPFPGSGEDFEMRTYVNGAGTGLEPTKSALTNSDVLTVTMGTPCGTFVNTIPILAVQFWQGISPPGNVIFPFVHLQVSQVLVVFDGSVAGPFGPTLLTTQPIALNFVPPAPLAGYVGRIQAFVSTPTAANGIFGGSDAHEVTFN
ncbi:MAG: right-handed parallel beta-helix repeat-containing protein [Planctomycetota bacterium]